MKKRYLCWDEKLIEKSENALVVMHKPVKRNISLICDDEWEGVHNGYGCIVKCEDSLRMYYRADTGRHNADGTYSDGKSVICMAESYDGGITFRKPDLCQFNYNGTVHTNIITGISDNFAVFYDTNPDCPNDEKFKALAYTGINKNKAALKYLASADGIKFTEKYLLDIEGTFDSYNIAFWDDESQQYFLYYRAFHTEDGEDIFDLEKVDAVNQIRDIRVATSKDFKNFVCHGRISFEEGQGDAPLYTNQIVKYYRSKETFIGFPARYLDRTNDKENLKFMPLADRREIITKYFGREGTSFTDCVIMTSSDGFTFNRRDEAFLTPGVEYRNNWWYGNCYTVYNLIETRAEEDGAPNEISFYMSENYRIKNVNFRRYTVRLDGFFSWYAPFNEGEILTKPIEISGEELHINFASSALGGLNITLCDENGEEIEGYKSYTIFGDSVDRPVEFEKPLSDLAEKKVKFKIKLKDTHLYSFCFE